MKPFGLQARDNRLKERPLSDEEIAEILKDAELAKRLGQPGQEHFTRAVFMGMLIEYCKRSLEDGMFTASPNMGDARYCLCSRHRAARERNNIPLPPDRKRTP